MLLRFARLNINSRLSGRVGVLISRLTIRTHRVALPDVARYTVARQSVAKYNVVRQNFAGNSVARGGFIVQSSLRANRNTQTTVNLCDF